MQDQEKSIFVKKQWWILGILVVVILSIGFLLSGGEDSTYTLSKVERGDLVQTVEVSGELESFNEAQLAFESSGTVAQVFAQAGESVAEDQIIAVLESSEVLSDLSAYQEALYLAQANLDQFLAGATDEELKSAKASLESAQADLVSKQELAVLNVQSAETALFYAQTDFDNTTADNDEDILEAYEDLQTILFSSIIDVRSALSSADELLGIENTIYNDSFEDVLSATDPQQLTSAKYYFNHAAESRDIAEDLVYALVSDSTFEEIGLASDAVNTALSDTSITLLYIRRVLDATVSDTVDLSLADVSTFKSTIDAERDTIQVESSSLSTQVQAIYSLAISTDDAQDLAQNTLDTKQQAYDQAVSNAVSSVAIAQATVDLRQAEYDALVVGKRAVDTAPFYAQVGQAQSQLSSAEARLRKTEVRAPFDGIITNIDVSVGEAVTAGVSVAGVQSTTSNYRVLVDVPEADIVKLALDDSAIITFDAYGDDLKVLGYVGAINAGENDIESVVYYSVEVYLNGGDELVLKSGMSADVIVNTDLKQNVLFVQQRGVYEYEDGTKYVRVPNGDFYEERAITTGLRGDSGLIEVISGLSEGDEVITAVNN